MGFLLLDVLRRGEDVLLGGRGRLEAVLLQQLPLQTLANARHLLSHLFSEIPATIGLKAS